MSIATDVDLTAMTALLAPVGEPVSAERLTGGMFATTYRVGLADGSRVVLKTAPATDGGLLTYERDLLRTEAEIYALGADRPDLLMPRVLHVDLTRTHLPGDALVVSHQPGRPWTETGWGQPGEDPRAARAQRELGAYLARVHTVTGTAFGYPNAPALRDATWRGTCTLVLESLLSDAARWGVDLPVAAVRDAWARHSAALDDVAEPLLVHADLWPGNVFVDPEGAVVGVIDTERAFWGDPLFDIVGADPFGVEVSQLLLAGHRDQAGVEWDVTSRDPQRRLWLYRLVLALMMTVEVGPRQYQGDWVPGHLALVEAMLTRSLAALA